VARSKFALLTRTVTTRRYTDANGPPGTTPGVQPVGKPMVFDLVKDPSENTPLTPGSTEFTAAVAAAEKAREAHILTIKVVPDQNALGNNPDFIICGAPDSKIRFPRFPNCSMTPQFWNVSICGSPATKWCNETSDGSCPADCPRFGPGSKPSPAPPPPPGPPLPPTPPVPAANAVGCFYDHKYDGECDLSFIIQGHCKGKPSRKVPYALTHESCNTLCYLSNSSFKYFGIQDGGVGCFCGDSYGRFGAARASACNVTCASNTHEICGGPNLNSVYRIMAPN
jgi:arylsulfatase A